MLTIYNEKYLLQLQVKENLHINLNICLESRTK